MNLTGKKIVIYENSYLKLLKKEALGDYLNVILFEDFKSIWNNPRSYNLSKEEIQKAIKEGKLMVEDIPSLYSDKITYKEKIICIALTLSLENEVIVYTKNEEIALDLFLNGLHVKNETIRAQDFENIGKNPENNELYLYDTCSIIEYLEKVDFSTNLHLIPICVLEELMQTKTQKSSNSIFFKLLNAFNLFPNNLKIIYSTTYTQGGGRFSYTDLLILYSSIAAKKDYKDKTFYFLTRDNQLYFEAIYLNIFNVIDKPAYLEENTVQKDVQPEEENVDKTEDLCDNVQSDVLDESTQYYDPVYFKEYTSSEIIDTPLENENDAVEEVKETSNLYLHEDINDEITKNHSIIPIKVVKKFKVVDSNLIEHVYSSNFIVIPPIKQKKKNERRITKISVGCYITFKDNPQKYYRVMSFTKTHAKIVPL